MRNLTIISLVLMYTIPSYTQWAGNYNGDINGDPVELVLHQSGQKVTGKMKDSYQTYEITAEANGNRLAGEVKEYTLGITFTLLGEMSGDIISCKMLTSFLGHQIETPFAVRREKNNDSSTTQSSTAQSSTPKKETDGRKIPFPSGATFPNALVGSWTKNEMYNSGYGSNFMGSNFAQSITFLADGGLSDGGSSASMSGSSYSARSSGGGSGRAEGVGWYALANQLHFMILKDGNWQSVHSGKWYVEDNKLLITGVNGEKAFLTR